MNDLERRLKYYLAGCTEAAIALHNWAHDNLIGKTVTWNWGGYSQTGIVKSIGPSGIQILNLKTGKTVLKQYRSIRSIN